MEYSEGLHAAGEIFVGLKCDQRHVIMHHEAFSACEN